MNTNLERLLLLSFAPGISPALARRVAHEQQCALAELVDETRWPDGALTAEARAYLRAPNREAIDSALNWQKDHSRIIALGDDEYPASLLQLNDAPLVLYVVGQPSSLSAAQIAMVGSRTPTSGGRDNASAFARELAQQGWLITSGLALGIDTAAHQGALSAGGQTVAVIGTGADRIYPAQNKALAHRIAENGCIVSELPLGSKPLRSHFPRRNRLIAALAQATVVVEAALSSGSLITAREALDLGREVMAIPGSIHNPLSRGPHQLIRQGAKLVETVADVLEELGVSGMTLASVSTDEPALDDDDRLVLEAMGYDPVSPDQVVDRTGLKPEAVAGMLLRLELQGQIESLCGGYLRKH